MGCDPSKLLMIFRLRFKNLTVRLIQDVRPRIRMGKVKHRVDGAGDGVERSAAYALSVEPIVFDEAQDGSLIRQTVVNIIAPGKGRDHQQRQARTVSAPALRMGDGGAGQPSGSITALPRS